jgi:hypothetical protein
MLSYFILFYFDNFIVKRIQIITVFFLKKKARTIDLHPKYFIMFKTT